jgi:ribose-phosphate pyrophosphokinase
MQILGFPGYERQAQALARALDVPLAGIDLHHFPDGEMRLRLPEDLSSHLVFCLSLDLPNDKLIALMLAAKTAREMGAGRLTLVAPYLCYMRQDKAFNPGEAVSQRIVGDFLAGLFDDLITVDPHLHRVHDLAEAVPVKRAIALTAAGLLGRYFAERPRRPLLVGPDQESEQWVRAVAEPGGLDYVVASKTRSGDRSVSIQLPPADYAGRDAVLVDDIASTGRTLAVAAGALIEAGVARVDVAVTHALFADDGLAVIKAAGVTDIWSTDSVLHESNALQLAPLLAGAVERVASGKGC